MLYKEKPAFFGGRGKEPNEADVSGSYLPIGVVRRSPAMKSRITRCFFSPINRPPKFGDELSDDIDYYPEEYLNRLPHDGATLM